MKSNLRTKLFYFAGIFGLIFGAIDPLEGSPIIIVGSILISLSSYLSHDKYRKKFIIASVLIIIGVSAMFILSVLGGFGGSSGLSPWWGLLIVPFPAGWLMTVIVLIIKSLKK